MLLKAALFSVIYRVFSIVSLESKHGLISFKNKFITQCDVIVSVKILFWEGRDEQKDN